MTLCCISKDYQVQLFVDWRNKSDVFLVFFVREFVYAWALALLSLHSIVTIFRLCVHIGSACSDIFSSGADKPFTVFSVGHPGQEPAL